LRSRSILLRREAVEVEGVGARLELREKLLRVA
jgi:hypothetical protein